MINGEEEYTEYTIGYSEGWTWIWYYWDDDKQGWGSGPVGCDAWMLKSGVASINGNSNIGLGPNP